MTSRIWPAMVLASSIVVGCVSASPASAPPPWTKGVNETTCSDWVNEMTESQRFPWARDWLVLLEHNANPDRMPVSDDEIGLFAGHITSACSSESVVTDRDLALAGEIAEVVFNQGIYRP